jgi:hypothetical protein
LYRYAMPMPKLTKELDRVSVYGFLTTDDKEFRFWDHFKLVLLGLEIRITEDYNLKDIFVVDFKKCGVGHLTKFTLPMMKKFELCLMVSMSSNNNINI